MALCTGPNGKDSSTDNLRALSHLCPTSDLSVAPISFAQVCASGPQSYVSSQGNRGEKIQSLAKAVRRNHVLILRHCILRGHHPTHTDPDPNRLWLGLYRPRDETEGEKKE